MTSSQPPQPNQENPGAQRSSRGSQGERRIVTALFCDVTGSTAMAEQLDAEEWTEIMNEAFEYLIAPVYKYEGTVARLMGDAVLAFFGAPFAHEEDPERATLAGLEMLEAIRPFQARIKQEYDMDFNIRVGINTGPVVTGDVGSNLATEYTAMGDAVNVAARMEQSAEPGTVLISGETHRLVAPLFDFEPLGSIEVKGKSEPVPAYRVLQRKAQPGRLRGIEGHNAPMVGRVEEFDTLRRVMDDVRQGRGHVVCLTGEAGLGKSRLVDEVHREWDAASSGSTWFEGRGIPYDTTRPYGIFHQLSKQVLEIADVDSVEAIREKAGVALQGLAPDQQAQVARTAELLLSVRDESGQAAPEGEALKRELFESSLNGWRAIASHTPMVMVCDDLHWADPASVELLQHLFTLAEDTSILFLCAFRPERQSTAWQVKQYAETEFPHRYTEVGLKPLSEEDSDVLVDSLLTISDLPTELRKLILQKTEGNPFFVEEVVRTLIESGAVTSDDDGMRWRAAARVEDIAIPDTLQSLLVSRIDRLEGEARQTLQMASVIGRNFYHRVLQNISDTSVELDRQLSTLQSVELIREEARLPELEFMFRHELTRDAAYSSILRRSRREFHLRVGEAIEALFPDRLQEEAHRLAHHFEEAGDNERALKYCVMAGDAAARLYANNEGAFHYARALGIAKKADAPHEQLIYLYTSLGRALELAGRHQEALDSYRELEALAIERSDRALELAGITPLATLYSTPTKVSNPVEGEAIARRALGLARELGDHRAEAKALWNLMLVDLYAARDPQRAAGFGEESIAIAREYGLTEELAFALNDTARPYFEIGKVAEARALVEEAAGLWRELGNLPMLTDSLHSVASSHFFLGEFDEALRRAEESLEVCRSIDNLWGKSAILMVIGQMHALRGNMAEAIETFREGMESGEKSGFVGGSFTGASGLAWSYEEIGDHAGALGYLDSIKGDFSVEVGWGPGLEAIVKAQKLFSGGAHDDMRGALDDALSKLHTIEAMTYFDFYGVVLADMGIREGAYDTTLAISQRYIDSSVAKGHRHVLADVLRLKGEALLGLGRNEEALAVLREAKAEAEVLGAPRTLWPVLLALGKLEAEAGNAAEAAALLAGAREAIEYIADHAGTPELRASFLAQAHVQAALSSS